MSAESEPVDDDADVWVVPNSGGENIYHTDPECPGIKTHRTAHQKKRSMVPGHRACRRCTDNVRNPDEPVVQQRTIETAHHVRNVIESDGPISRRDLELETGEATRPVRRALRFLKERGLIGETYGDDKRIPLYQLTEDDRGQIDPVATGLLSVFVGVVLLLGYAIALAVIV